MRELDERLGLETLISGHLNDSRQGLNTQFSLADLLRQSVYSRLAGYEDLNDAARVSADPTFRLIGSPKLWDRGAALTSTLHWFETELLTREENLVGLMAVNREVLAQAERPTRADRIVLDMDSSESPVHGAQEGSAYNGHFESVCYHPLFLFSEHGDCLALQFAIKVMHAAERGAITLDNIDVPLTIADGESIIVLPDQMFATTDDLINACQNAVSMAFGAATIALNRYREDKGIRLPDLIRSEIDHWVALVYQIRNAFAHDIARPKWCIRGRFAREYRIGRVGVDLTGLHGAPFDYSQIGGPDKLFALKEYGLDHILGELVNTQMEPTRAGS